MRLRRSRLLACAVAGVLTVAGVSGLVATTTGAGAAPVADPVRYAINRPVCAAPKDPARCAASAQKLVEVRRGTAGAYPYRVNAGHGPTGGYTPAQLASAYGYNPRTSRSNLTVGVVLWHDAPTVLSDLNVFNKKYGIPRETRTSFRKVNQRGRTAPLPARDRDSASEIALDTQAVRAVCRTCRILLVEADGPYDTDLAAAVNTAVRLGADVVTNSYGTPERRFSASVVRAYQHPGKVIVASTGDDGWFGWDFSNDPASFGDRAPSFPSTSPSVVAVGGTTLTLNRSNRRSGETVWNDNGPHNRIGSAHGSQGASGGGCSRYFRAQPWQVHMPGYAQAGCNGHRLASDLALVADPSTGFDIYDSYGSGGWVRIGGTSLSAPLAAGMFALAGGSRGARVASSALYSNTRAIPSRRYDVTRGGNGYCHTDTPSACSQAVYNARLLGRTRNPNTLTGDLVDCSYSRTGGESVPRYASRECKASGGFDGPSGVGTPRSALLFLRSDPYLYFTQTRAIPGRAAAFHARVRAPLAGTSIVRTTWSWGDGRVLRSTNPRVTHVYRRAGNYRLTLYMTDSRYQTVVITRTVAVR